MFKGVFIGILISLTIGSEKGSEEALNFGVDHGGDFGGGFLDDFGGGFLDDFGGGFGGGFLDDFGGGFLDDFGGGFLDDFGGDFLDDFLDDFRGVVVVGFGLTTVFSLLSFVKFAPTLILRLVVRLENGSGCSFLQLEGVSVSLVVGRVNFDGHGGGNDGGDCKEFHVIDFYFISN